MKGNVLIDTQYRDALLAPTYPAESLTRLSEEDKNKLARIEGSAFPALVRAALTSRLFGDFETAERIKAANPHLFTRGSLLPYRSSIPNLVTDPLEVEAAMASHIH